MTQRLENEILHGKKLIAGGAEDIWNWASPAGQIRAQRRSDFFVKTAHITNRDKVLEIGCGTGLFTRKVYESTKADITATDLSEDLLIEAREKFSEGKFLIDDAMKMKFTDGSFDVVFGSSILHHLELKKALEEILRVMKKGGRMVFAEPNMINPQILIQKNIPFIKERLGDSPDETAIVRWKFKKLMEDTGFINVRIFPYDFLHPITPKPLIGLVNSIGKIMEKIPLLKEIAGSVIIYGEK
ncbi:MAG: class I SAM-dependent methyltransferase [Bacteroidia bacterium]